MIAISPCPEDLLARAADEPIGRDDRAALKMHLRTCGTCRAALAAATALRAEPVVLAGDDRLLARLASRAARRPARPPSSRFGRRRWRRLGVLGLALAGAALAGLRSARRHIGEEAGGVPSLASPRSAAESPSPAEVSKTGAASPSLASSQARPHPPVTADDGASLLRKAREALSS